MKPRPPAPEIVDCDLARAIKERDWLTRFSYAWGPLARFTDKPLAKLQEDVREDLARMAHRVG